jgi:hypothetical protein
MEKSCDFLLGASDAEVARTLAADADADASAGPDPAVGLDRRFTPEEEFFLALDRPFVVPRFEIHHPVDNPVPSPAYLAALRSLSAQWVALAPGVFTGLSWYFNPRDLFHPTFVQLLSAKGKHFLYLLQPELTFRGRYAEVLDRGTNDWTPRYQTSRLFVEAQVLPLHTWEVAPGGRKLFLAKLFEDTWVGETGQSYLRTGQWIDREVTKVLTRAALVPGAKTFPFYPLRCRFGTLAVGCPDLDDAGRRRAAATLDAAWPLVAPWAPTIQADLKADAYRDDHPLIERLRTAWGNTLALRWGRYSLEPVLSGQGKEYVYHGA